MLLLLSAEFSKKKKIKKLFQEHYQFGSTTGLTVFGPGSGSKAFDTLIVFWNGFF